MDFTDLKSKNVQELGQAEKDLRVKLGKLKFELANKTLKNFSQIRQVKKDIARVMTALKSETRSANS
jgi:ribosomal protein L29